MLPILLLALALPPGSGGLDGRGAGAGAETQALAKRTPERRGGRQATGTTNVLVIVGDDLGVDMVGVYAEGNDLPATPALDTLASTGVLFRNAWTRPVCSPTRAGILTGRHAFRHGLGFVIASTGVALQASELTLPEALDGGASGYAHAAFGKWHLGNDSSGGALAPNLAGFAHFSGTLSSLFPPQEDYFQWTHVTDGVSVLETDYEPEVVTDEAIAWMNAQAQPFFCYLAFNLPHEPYHRPPDYLHSIDFTGVDPDPEVEPRPYYKAMVEAMDTLIGRILTDLDPGVLANTLILFTGDNGTPLGLSVPPFSGVRAKTTTYEGGVNVPLIVSGPGVASTGECAALVDTLDLYATVAEVAGVDPAAQAPGTTFDAVSLVPYLQDVALPSLRDTVYTEVFYPNGEPPLPEDYVCNEPPMGGRGFQGLLRPSQPPGQSVVCQPDIGFGGPGALRLSICGPGLLPGRVQSLLLVGGLPGAGGILFEGNGFNPIPIGAGSIVPAPALHFQSFPIQLDAAGSYHGFVPHLGGTEYLYYQALAVDPGLPGGFAISNAVQVRLFTHSSAMRDARYKLILDAYTCAESFFDLQTDPFELVDLLGVGLSAPEQAGYDALKAKLGQLVGF